MNMQEKLRMFMEDKRRFTQGGSPDAIERQHKLGKLTARERIEKLLDPGSFTELSPFETPVGTGFDIDKEPGFGDGVVTGYGEVNGRPVYLWAQDATILGGTMATKHAQKIIYVLDKGLKARVPLIGIYDSEGMRPEDLVDSGYYSYDLIMYLQTLASGVVPQISLVMGPCVGEAMFSAMLTDFVFMVRGTSYMHAAPPPPGVSREELGGAWKHAKVYASCDVLAENDEECLEKARELLSFLPQNNTENPPKVDTGDDPNRKEEALLTIAPADTSKAYDMRKLIPLIADNHHYFDLRRHWCLEMTVGFIRLDGRTVGIVANNPVHKAGCMDCDTSDKLSKMCRFCDAFDIPIVFLVDNPAYIPMVQEEKRGIIRHGCHALMCHTLDTVPMIHLIIRKAYGGGGGLAMPAPMMGSELSVAWPTLERGLMGPKGAVAIVRGRELGAIKDEAQRATQEQVWIKEMQDKLDDNLRSSAQDIIDPRETRPFLIKTLKTVRNKQLERTWRKHDCIVL